MPDELIAGQLMPADLRDLLSEVLVDLLGVPVIATDVDGNAMGPLDHPLAYCGTIVRAPGAKTYCLRRRDWGTAEPELEDQIRQSHACAGHSSHACCERFLDASVPIRVGDRLLGYIVLPRTLQSAPDIAHFRALAEQAGMDAQLGQEIAEAAYVVPPEHLKRITVLVRVLAELSARMAHERYQAQQIRELEGLRDSLVHMIVHDLRTPLTSIMGSLQTLMDTEYEGELVREFVPIAFSSSEQLLEMVNTLLDINKMESGNLELNVQPVPVEEVVHLALDQVRGLARERGLELSVAIADALPVIQADRELLRRLLVNLLGNALKFTPQGRVWVTAGTEPGGLWVAVNDTGPGIPPEDQARIFEKFGQAAARTEGHKHSTGLGLTFCRMVAEAHGGDVQLESEVGRGSSFRVHLPLSPPGPQDDTSN